MLEAPLAMIDAATVSKDDYMPLRIEFESRTGHNFALKYSPGMNARSWLRQHCFSSGHDEDVIRSSYLTAAPGHLAIMLWYIAQLLDQQQHTRLLANLCHSLQGVFCPRAAHILQSCWQVYAGEHKKLDAIMHMNNWKCRLAIVITCKPHLL